MHAVVCSWHVARTRIFQAGLTNALCTVPVSEKIRLESPRSVSAYANFWTRARKSTFVPGSMVLPLYTSLVDVDTSPL